MIYIVSAVITDWIAGDPISFPHPVKLMGKVISFEEKLVRKAARNDGDLFYGGLLIVLINISITFMVPYYILLFLETSFIYPIINVYFLYTAIAAKCLHREGIKVYKALEESIEKARYHLSFIVGRETDLLTEEEIIAAGVETVAENTSDGVIAPLLFAIVGGAPLALVYKMVNTMDSMLGYKTQKYKYIGFFPAKIDDLFNFIPARITGILMNISSLFRFNGINGIKVMWRYRKNHKSPNCGYPEGAVAGLLGIKLGGDHMYHGELVKKPQIGDGNRSIEKRDIPRTIEIMYRSEILLLVVYVVLRLI